MYVLHVGKRTIYDKINDLPPFEIPPNEPFLIEDAFIGSKVLEHLRLQGLVEVGPKGKGKSGFPEWDVEGATQLAKNALKKAHEELVMRYVSSQRDGRIKKGLPPLPPSDVVAEIISDDGYDLKSLGVNIEGAGFSLPENEQTRELNSLRDKVGKFEGMLEAITRQNEILAKQLQASTAK